MLSDQSLGKYAITSLEMHLYQKKQKERYGPLPPFCYISKLICSHRHVWFRVHGLQRQFWERKKNEVTLRTHHDFKTTTIVMFELYYLYSKKTSIELSEEASEILFMTMCAWSTNG
jgi:hypothetical protein